MWQRLIRLADLLFGDATRADRADRRALARYLAVAAGLALVVFARRPDAILRAQFWAEDGSVFFYDQLTRGLWPALRSLYGGFPFVAQRLVASLASVVPTVAVPLAYNASASAITALTMATFSLPGFRHLVRRDGVRAAACVATVCIPAGQELLATPTTLGYFLAVWLIYLSLMPTPRGRALTVAWCLGGVLSVLSAPLAPVAAPLWLLRAVRGIGRRDARDLAFGVSQTAAQLGVLAMAGLLGGGAALQGIVGFEQPPGGLWSLLTTLGWVVASCVDATVFSMAGFERLKGLGTLAVVVPAVLVGVALTLAVRDLSPEGRVTIGLAIYVFVASLALVLVGRPLIVLVIQHVSAGTLGPFGALGTRHRAMSNVALVLLVAGLFDGARRARTRVAALVACALLLVGWVPGFRIPPFPDLHWPLWAARLEEKLASGSGEPLVIPSHPPRFFEIRFDAPAPPAR